ncbi:MAG: M20 family metallopeptidase [Phycisphaerales bacterium]
MKELLKNLIKAKSTSDTGELSAAKVLAEYFKAAGLKPEIDVWDKNRANLTVRLKSTGEKEGILLVGHLDVVPAQNEAMFTPSEKAGKIFGRGSCDMKGGLACAAAAIVETFKSDIKLKGDIIFSATAGEETDSSGVQKFIKSFKDKNICGIIVPEPTDFELVSAHRGLLWMKIVTKGKSAHSSMPQLGINAIDSMRIFLNELTKFKIPGINKQLGKASLSVNKICGGSASNIVPDSCSTQIDIRTIPGQEIKNIIADINKIIVRLGKKNPNFQAELEVIRHAGSLQTDEKSMFVKEIKKVLDIEAKAVAFTTDAPYLTVFNKPIVIFGPGSPGLCHKQNEHIKFKDMVNGVKYYKKIFANFLS